MDIPTRSLALLAIMIITYVSPVGAASPEFPPQRTVESTELVRVGEGTFRWMFFKVYDGALYLEENSTNADPLANVAKCLELQYAVGLSAEDFRKSGNEILRKNVTEETWQSLQERLGKLNKAYRSVEKGDRYALYYLPEKGTTLALNDQPLVTIEGADFAAAYFSIWLGDNAAKASFRRDLLGN